MIRGISTKAFGGGVAAFAFVALAPGAAHAQLGPCYEYETSPGVFIDYHQ